MSFDHQASIAKINSKMRWQKLLITICLIFTVIAAVSLFFNLTLGAVLLLTSLSLAITGIAINHSMMNDIVAYQKEINQEFLKKITEYYDL